MDKRTAPPADRDEWQFQAWARGLPWYSEFQQQYGEAPNLDDPDYDYRAAYRAGIVPERYAPDGGRYHWPSLTSDGQQLKSDNHPTMWAEKFMSQTGVDPFSIGITTPEAARAKLLAEALMRGEK